MTQVQAQTQTQTKTGFGFPAQTYLTDDRAAQEYVARRQRCLTGLQADLADPTTVTPAFNALSRDSRSRRGQARLWP